MTSQQIIYAVLFFFSVFGLLFLSLEVLGQ
ncbi:hypothetical protein GGD56_005302 [Rhizobium mongolense]|uniref:Uncharacterized protein n=1 Tax=Rhizobium mongolense TaxID=57676 RepID=A0ABR6IVC4_9HYPH|nr:hypothetical protein [Rhizobium mongolense]